jgi:hypothetical protein
MIRGLLVILCAACLGGGAALAQTGMSGTGSSMTEPPPAGGPLHTRYVTATGATVPRPSQLPRDAEPTRTGRSSYEKDRRIEQSICSNC